MSNFRPIDRETGYLMPPSVNEWLPERHLARFIVELVEGLDLRAMIGSYRGSGSASYHPCVLLAILLYGYATGVFSSRKLERATYDSVAFRFVASNQHPDHDTIATFRRRSPVQAMAHRLKTAEGKALYALRKQAGNRYSALSNRRWASGSSICGAWSLSVANGAW